MLETQITMCVWVRYGYVESLNIMRAICKFYNPCKNNIIQHQNICYKIQTQCFCFAFTSFLAFFFMCVFTLKEEYMCVPLISILILLVDKSITIGFLIESVSDLLTCCRKWEIDDVRRLNFIHTLIEKIVHRWKVRVSCVSPFSFARNQMVHRQTQARLVYIQRYTPCVWYVNMGGWVKLPTVNCRCLRCRSRRQTVRHTMYLRHTLLIEPANLCFRFIFF